MGHPRHGRSLIALEVIIAIAVLALAGCKKNAPSTQADAGATVDTNAAPADPAQAAAPVQVVPSRPIDFKPVQEAVQAKQYDKAAQDLLALQRSPLTPEQSIAVQNQMRAFQKTLIGALASGDPNAQAAVQRLREGSAHH